MQIPFIMFCLIKSQILYTIIKKIKYNHDSDNINDGTVYKFVKLDLSY